MSKTCLFTIVAPNYLAQAITLKQSLDKFASVDFKIILVSDQKFNFHDPDINKIIINSKNLNINEYNKLSFSYNILEHCTNIKPACFNYFIDNYDYIYYIDPDIYFYQDPLLMNQFFEDADVILTPHSLSPVLDGKSPSELEFLRTGLYNLGFIGIRKSQSVKIFIDWWRVRCELFGINETYSGLFVDQKWIDLAPIFFKFIKTITNTGFNCGYWNLHERPISYLNNNYMAGFDQLFFFHFSGLDRMNFANISRHQSRTIAREGTAIYKLFQDYSKNLISNEVHNPNLKLPYSCFDNNYNITELARKYFWKNSCNYEDNTIFNSNSKLFKDLKRLNLITSKNIKTQTFGMHSDLSAYNNKIYLVEKLLNISLLILGPYKFFLLRKFIIQRFSITSRFFKW